MIKQLTDNFQQGAINFKLLFQQINPQLQCRNSTQGDKKT